MVLDFLRQLTLSQIAWYAAIENALVFTVAVLGGEWAVRRYGARRCSGPPAPLSRQEIALSATCVLLNAGVTVAGVLLFQRGVIRVRDSWSPLAVAVDVAVLLMAMDAAMYLLHRAAHWRRIYPWVHQTHHAYHEPRPLTLFVLNPFEVLGFGGLWLAVIALYPATWQGMAIYLGLNLFFGTLGHLGVEPFPPNWPSSRWSWISTSTFHSQHHGDKNHNFGFYTLIWDRLFGTLQPAEKQPPPSKE